MVTGGKWQLEKEMCAVRVNYTQDRLVTVILRKAFDTFGESCVLFVASCCVLILLRVDKDEDPESRAIEDMNDRHYEPRNDTILQKVADFLVPLMIIFGIYVVLNGHISPGGGFSGGAIIGSGLILYLTAYGFEKNTAFYE